MGVNGYALEKIYLRDIRITTPIFSYSVYASYTYLTTSMIGILSGFL